MTALLTAVAFLVGENLQSQSKTIQGASTIRIPVSATIEKRVVAPTASFSASVSAGTTVPVIAPAPDGTISQVVVAVNVKPGDALKFGRAIGVVSGRPVFILWSRFPFYRELARHDTGSDVTALQTSLKAIGYPLHVSNVMDQATLTALATMYSRAGFAPPGGKIDPHLDPREVMTVNAKTTTVVTTASVGSVLDATHPLAQLQTAPDQVRGRIGILDDKQFEIGAKVRLVGPGGYQGEGTVTSVGAFRPATDSQPVAGMDVQIEFVQSATAPPPASSPVTVSTEATAVASLAVPSIAIRQDGAGSYLEVKSSSGGSKARFLRATVTVVDQSDGWSSITSASGLVTQGATVKIR